MNNSLIGKVNQSVLQDRVNSLRNQKEQIRQRLQNPGLYPDSSTPNVTLENLNQYYRPSQELAKQSISELSNFFNNVTEGSSAYSENTPNTTSGRGLGLNSGLANTIGSIASQAASRSGAGPASSFIGSAIAGALGKENASKDIMTSALKAAAVSAVPQLSPVLAAYGLANTLAGLFGYDLGTEAKSFANIGNQFAPGFGYTWGMSSKQNKDESSPGLGSLSTALADLSNSMTGLSNLGYGYSTPGTNMSSIGTGLQTNPNTFEVSYNNNNQGGYSAFGDSSLSSDVSGGNWGGSADSDF